MAFRITLLVLALCSFCQGCAMPQAETYKGPAPENIDYRETGGVI